MLDVSHSSLLNLNISLPAAPDSVSAADLPDTVVRRGNQIICRPPDEVSSGYTSRRRAYAILRDHLDCSHSRSKIVSNEATRMAFCRLPDGGKLLLSVERESSVEKIQADFPKFCKLSDDRAVKKLYLENLPGVTLNFYGAKIRGINIDSSNSSLLASVILDGQNYYLRSAVNSGRPAAPFEIARPRGIALDYHKLNDGSFEEIDTKGSPGWPDMKTRLKELTREALKPDK